jgi:hypothetical protein
VWEALGCAPLIVTGPRLEAIRACLEARAIVLEQEGAIRREQADAIRRDRDLAA